MPATRGVWWDVLSEVAQVVRDTLEAHELAFVEFRLAQVIELLEFGRGEFVAPYDWTWLVVGNDGNFGRHRSTPDEYGLHWLGLQPACRISPAGAGVLCAQSSQDSQSSKQGPLTSM